MKLTNGKSLKYLKQSQKVIRFALKKKKKKSLLAEAENKIGRHSEDQLGVTTRITVCR